MSTEKNAKPAKPRAQPLRRGKACLVCRHLKIKCDGIRPICGPCARYPKDDPCEFTDVMSRTQELENTVLRLKSRINELERVPGSSRSAGYLTTGPTPQGWASRSPERRRGDSNSPFGSSSTSSPTSPLSSENSFFGAQEPPVVMIQMLLDYFLPQATQFGFFLRVNGFRESVLIPLPFGDPSRPSPALLSAVYLWGVQLSQSQPLLASEPVFLKRAQQHLSVEIAENKHSAHLLHTIQAQVLLSTYLFRNKRFLEAEFHANGAATLATGYELHRIRSARAQSSFFGAPEFALSPPRSAIEEGERIRAFWAVACLQSSLNIALNSASTNLSILESLSGEIDTPWPMEIADYEAGLLPAAYRGQETIKTFLTADPPLTLSPTSTLYAQAAVLLHRASRLGSKWSPNLAMKELSYISSCNWLAGRIVQFWEALPPLSNEFTGLASDSEAARTLILTHATTLAATIALHRPCSFSACSSAPSALEKCTHSARLLVASLAAPHASGLPDPCTAHPIVGTLLTFACLVFLDAARNARHVSRSLFETLGLGLDIAHAPPPQSPEEKSFKTELQRGVETMRLYAARCPLAEYQLSRLQQQCEALS